MKNIITIGDNMAILNYGGHLGRHLEFQSYSSMLERLSTQKLLLEVSGIQPYITTFYSRLCLFSQKYGGLPPE